MKRHQAFRSELMPDGEQPRLMRYCVGLCRVFYNAA
ncbi:MAG: helix-turn-helix domain-containing protein [Planctomycetota bacterium]|nr:helix-turn-helix domain-containing protein [Planctomycetota bacterium]